MRNIILMGAPGAGKGTISNKLIEAYGMVHISTGDLLREEQAKKTEIGLAIKKYIDNGGFAPDDLMMTMLGERFVDPSIKTKGFILDGFPRTITQAVLLDRTLNEKGSVLDAVIYINAPEDIIKKRITGRRACKNCKQSHNVHTGVPPAKNDPMNDQSHVYLPTKEGKCVKCGGELTQRPDDNEEALKTRLKLFYEITQPILSFYKKRGIVKEFNGALGVADFIRQFGPFFEAGQEQAQSL